MKHFLAIAMVSLGVLAGCSKPVQDKLPSIIPQPVSMKILAGHYSPKASSQVKSQIVSDPEFVHPGQYHIKVSRKGIVLSAKDSMGIFYGMQSLHQFIPVDDSGRFFSDSLPGSIPSMDIIDYPRFQWRGLMLDCSRTFLPIAYLKKTIDRMAKYKLNVLHLHLTDDQGWRIEIRKYPELTTICSRFSVKYPDEISGFYLQKELVDLVAYASARFITIVPEIEMRKGPIDAAATAAILRQIADGLLEVGELEFLL